MRAHYEKIPQGVLNAFMDAAEQLEIPLVPEQRDLKSLAVCVVDALVSERPKPRMWVNRLGDDRERIHLRNCTFPGKDTTESMVDISVYAG
ncbi:MAG TPA: hypothetical protein VIG99_19965, partial [Myxococcaceae bacterium]